MYNKDDIVYILENDQVVRKAKVAGRQDDLYIVQLIGSCGAIHLPESRLFESAEAAEETAKDETEQCQCQKMTLSVTGLTRSTAGSTVRNSDILSQVVFTK